MAQKKLNFERPMQTKGEYLPTINDLKLKTMIESNLTIRFGTAQSFTERFLEKDDEEIMEV